MHAQCVVGKLTFCQVHRACVKIGKHGFCSASEVKKKQQLM